MPAKTYRDAYVDLFAGPPSLLQQKTDLLEQYIRATGELYKRVREGTDSLEHARAPARRAPAAPAITTRRGRPTIHDWDTIERLDAAFCRAYHADNNCPPTWKERERALKQKLGIAPHWKTLQLHYLEKKKGRKSRSI